MEFVVNPADARKAGLRGRGLGARSRNQFSACEGVVNVSKQVPRGVISAIFGWQGPSDDNPFGDAALLRQ